MLVPFQGVNSYVFITQGVAQGYMIRGFQPIGRCDNVSLEMSNEPYLVFISSHLNLHAVSVDYVPRPFRLCSPKPIYLSENEL